MSKGNSHDDFDFGNDPELRENFYRNIDKVLNDIEIEDNETEDLIEEIVASEVDDTTNEVEESEAVYAIEEEEESETEVTAEGEKDSEVVDTIEESEAEDTTEEAEESESEASIEEEFEIAVTAEEDEPSETDDAVTTDDIDEALVDINNSLAMQISEELESLDTVSVKDKKRARMMKIQIGVIIGLVSLLGIAFFLGFTKPGNRLLLKMGINIGGKIWDAWTQDFENEPDIIEDIDYLDEEDIASDAVEVDPDTIEWPEHPGFGRREEGVYNILLLGEEAIDAGTSRGRTDLIIIATLNKNNKSIKLTSLMRDTLVQIPGYRENKLNSAYEKGDVDLLYETISLNFNIHLDGSVLVNFENFEKIIDLMGGLELTLTASEAKYLRNTNYISEPKYRTVVEGTQLMNGNQVLGYSRIRKRAAITGNNNDYGRTDRHRIILNAIFEKYKSKSEMELASMMFKMLPMIKTDIDSKTFEKLLSTFIEMGTTKIDQLRIPADGTFTDNVKVRGMDVLIPDLTKNISILHEFIFGN
ncbi:MAG: LCP family protein [Clostridiales bacterium]|jgi:LCP family protein required for cell wall assembly|nr:LCP family protein [Clostridiales bacterium]